MSAVAGVTLAIDAATYVGSVAVIRDGIVVADRTVAMRGEDEERLMPAVLAALEASGARVRDVARVVCGEGPGSFTSLRIAGAIAKGIAFGNSVPIFAVSSLALVVAGAQDLAPGDYLPVLDAMRGERFVAPFRLDADGSVCALGVAARVAAADVGANATTLAATVVGPLETPSRPPHARGAARMLGVIVRAGAVALDAWEPTYGRLAEAQVKWEAAHNRPLGA